jgi:hypothetical protein
VATLFLELLIHLVMFFGTKYGTRIVSQTTRDLIVEMGMRHHHQDSIKLRVRSTIEGLQESNTVVLELFMSRTSPLSQQVYVLMQTTRPEHIVVIMFHQEVATSRWQYV